MQAEKYSPDPEKIGLMQPYIFLKFQTLRKYQVKLDCMWVLGSGGLWKLFLQLPLSKHIYHNDKIQLIFRNSITQLTIVGMQLQTQLANRNPGAA